MEKNKHGKNGGSAFFWGLIVGALLASLLTTKKGRQILKDLIELGIEMFEEFIEEKKAADIPKKAIEKAIAVKDKVVEEIKQASREVEEEISPPEQELSDVVAAVEEMEVEEEIITSEPEVKAKTNGNSHHKKRLFRGIRKSK